MLADGMGFGRGVKCNRSFTSNSGSNELESKSLFESANVVEGAFPSFAKQSVERKSPPLIDVCNNADHSNDVLDIIPCRRFENDSTKTVKPSKSPEKEGKCNWASIGLDGSLCVSMDSTIEYSTISVNKGSVSSRSLKSPTQSAPETIYLGKIKSSPEHPNSRGDEINESVADTSQTTFHNGAAKLTNSSVVNEDTDGGMKLKKQRSIFSQVMKEVKDFSANLSMMDSGAGSISSLNESCASLAKRLEKIESQFLALDCSLNEVSQ